MTPQNLALQKGPKRLLPQLSNDLVVFPIISSDPTATVRHPTFALEGKG